MPDLQKRRSEVVNKTGKVEVHVTDIIVTISPGAAVVELFLIMFNLFSVQPKTTPKGRPGMSDVTPLSGISGLSFDSTLLSPLLFFCLVLLVLPFLSYLFLPTGPFFCTFSKKFFTIFH